MPLHHYIAATFLANFSRDEKVRRRERVLWIADKRAGTTFATSAERICAINDFYTVQSSGWLGDAVDRCLSSFEPTLHLALRDLAEGNLDAAAWAGALVPFITSLLVRGPDFNHRYEDRLEANLPGISKHFGVKRLRDNTNVSRVMEQQRLWIPVLAAQWHVLKVSGQYSQITSDMGYAISLDRRTKNFGIAVPIGVHHILHVIPTTRRIVAQARDGKWWPIIEPYDLEDSQHLELLRAVAGQARRFVIGPDEETVRGYATKEPKPPRSLDPDELGFINGALRRKWEMAYFAILPKLSERAGADGSILRIDLERDTPAE
jgi:Protein of unknown function (DUF4238)